MQGTLGARDSSILALISELKHCSRRGDLQQGKTLHLKALHLGCETNRYLAAALITMYGKCGGMSDASELFERVSGRDVVLWTCLINGYVENGESLRAMDVFSCMDREPNSVTFVAALKACPGLAAATEKWFSMAKGVWIHKLARVRGFAGERTVTNTLIDMYCKCGNLRHARAVFDSMIRRDVVSWNVIILGYVEEGHSFIALDLFRSMDVSPDSVTFLAVLKACEAFATLDPVFCVEKVVEIQKWAEASGSNSDVFVTNALVDLYSKCGNMSLARNVFNGMSSRDVVSWTSLITGYVDTGQSWVSLDLFRNMDCQPNAVTYAAVVRACGGLFSDKDVSKEFCIEKCVSLHKRALEAGLGGHLSLSSSLVKAYSDCRSLIHARAVFNTMTRRDVVSWTSLISGHTDNGQSLAALDLFMSMEVEPDSVTFVAALKACTRLATEKQLDKEFWLETCTSIHKRAKHLGCDVEMFLASSLVEMYCKCGNMLHARTVFERAVHRDVVLWNVLILGYVDNGESFTALELFTSMNCEPDPVTFIAALKAARGSVSMGEKIHARICQLGLEQNQVVGNCLVDFYTKCGMMKVAEQVFQRMNSRDVVSWNALITGYSCIGDSAKVFELVKRMEEAGVEPNGVTFFSVLSTCSHAGLVDDGKRYFEAMVGYGIAPTVEHYTCMVDMLGRANRLQEALSLVSSMPFEANKIVQTVLLGGKLQQT